MAKTGRLDPALIAHFGEAIRPLPHPIAPEQAQALAELVTCCRQIVEVIGMGSNRRRQGRSPRVLRGIERTLATLQATLAELDYEIDDQISGPPAWRVAKDLLTSVPGVGPITAHTLIAPRKSARETGILTGVT